MPPIHTSMLQQHEMYKRSFRSRGSSAAQTCRRVPARSLAMSHRACTSGIMSASGWKIEPRYGNCQLFLSCLSPQRTFGSLSCASSSLSFFISFRSVVCDRCLCQWYSFSRRCIFKPRRLSLASLFHPHIQHRRPASPSGSG